MNEKDNGNIYFFHYYIHILENGYANFKICCLFDHLPKRKECMYIIHKISYKYWFSFFPVIAAKRFSCQLQIQFVYLCVISLVVVIELGIKIVYIKLKIRFQSYIINNFYFYFIKLKVQFFKEKSIYQPSVQVIFLVLF